ncbi:hypothetical protein [Pontibacter russatus]|uniref:hypothetical protein n=1 Tax=Pontibacter russatus TaxID=2694929 RepID=UPI00137A2D73|nr:hypothetical protein [Pontibacter russatus]
MKTKLLLPLLLLLLLGGCISEEDDFISKYCPGSCTVVKGRLTTGDGSEPMAGVKLNVYWHSYESYFKLGYSQRRKAVAITDQIGNYELRFLLRDDELNLKGRYENGYIVVAPVLEEGRYITCRGETTIYEEFGLRRDTTITLDYTLPKAAYLDLTPKNTEAMQPGDSFRAEVDISAGRSNTERCNTGVIWHQGYSSATTLNIPANRPLTLRITSIKNGTATETVKTIQLKPGERLPYEPAF